MTNTTEAENLARRLHDSHGGRSCAAIEMIREQAAEIERLKDDLSFIERWANHHAQKPCFTAEQALGVIQHYPTIKTITKTYSDGRVPETYDPYAEIERLKAEAELFARHIGLKLERKDALLRESLRVIDKAFDYDGDVFGLMHNDAGDLVDGIETELG